MRANYRSERTIAMPNRRRVLLFGPLATLLALGVSGWLLWPRPSAITRENAAKVLVGMTLAEVEVILGGPARDDTTGPTRRRVEDEDRLGTGLFLLRITSLDAKLFGLESISVHDWISDDAYIRLVFDPEERLIASLVSANSRLPESSFERLCRWFGL
jgi:hypothetical protein